MAKIVANSQPTTPAPRITRLRGKLRELLVLNGEGEVEREEFRTLTHRILGDALEASEGFVNIRILDAKRERVVNGEPITIPSAPDRETDSEVRPINGAQPLIGSLTPSPSPSAD